MAENEASLLTPEALEVLNKPGMGVFSTLMPDGVLQTTLAGVLVDGDELVTHTAPRAQRVKNLRRDPHITVLVIDTDDPTRYVEVRGIASLRECKGREVGPLFREQAVKYGLPARVGEAPDGITIVQVRIKPIKVNHMRFRPQDMGPGVGQRPAPDLKLDGAVVREGDDYFIEFHRTYDHAPEQIFAALTEPRRLVIWEHPVEYFPGLQVGATIYAHLNPEAGAFALGKIIELEPPRSFVFRWTTNNAMLPPEFTLSFTVGEDRGVNVRFGPFTRENGFLGLLAATHVHLDHLEQAITTPEAELPSPPWPETSVVGRSGVMMDYARAYGAKLAADHPDLPIIRPARDHMAQRPQGAGAPPAAH